MDEIKLINWEERFTENAKQLKTEYNSFFSNHSFEETFSIELDESDEWELIIKEDVPAEIKNHLQEIFLASKPEDSI